jgi:LAS superfamily LD-carboxypeptidase LdcB
MAQDTVLRSISSDINRMSQENGQFRKIATQQNNSISSFIKDISKMFSTNTNQQGQLSNSIGDLQQTSAQTGQKVDQTNNLMQNSISIQTQMLNEMKNTSSTLRELYNLALNNSNTMNNQQGLLSGGGGGWLGAMGKMLAAFAGGGAVGLAASDIFGGDSSIISGIMNAGKYMEGGFSDFRTMIGNEFSSQNTTGEMSENIGPVYADVSAGSESTKQILNTIKNVESGGDYSTPNKAGTSSASGAYQFIDETWQSLTKKYNIGTEYNRAMHAPPQIQDQIAAKYVEEILRKNNNDVTKIPVVWLTGNAQGNMSSEAQAINPSVSAYQQKWMNAYAGSQRNLNRTDHDVDESQYSGGPQQDWMQFLEQRSSGANISGLNPEFGKKLAAALAEAEQMTGQTAKIISGYRSTEEQAMLYDRYKRGIGGLAAPPGRSRHERGNAVDIADGPVREALRNGIDSKYGIEDLYSKIGKDMPHFQLSGASNGVGGYSPQMGGGFGGGVNMLNPFAMGMSMQQMSGAGSPMDLFGGMLPMMMMGGMGGPLGDIATIGSAIGGITSLLGGILPSLGGNTFGGLSNDNDHDLEETNKIQSTNEPKAVMPIQAAALEADSVKFRQPPQQQVQQQYAENISVPQNTNMPSSGQNLTMSSSPSWYLQLAGRIHNNEAMKFKGGVFA